MTDEEAEVVQRIIGFRFANRSLLAQAFTHPSAVEREPDRVQRSCQRLEFLGDAILGMIVADALFREHPAEDEGALTRLKSHFVSEASLAAATRRLDLGKFLALSRGERQTGGAERPSNLSSLFEALVAAIYLDAGLDAAREFVDKHLLRCPPLADSAGELDAKSALQEFTQAKMATLPEYRVLAQEGPPHAPLFTVEVVLEGKTLATGQGRSKKEAEQNAARQALDLLREGEAEGDR